MKPFVIVGVAAVLIVWLPMKVQGAQENMTTSKELEKAVEQLQEVLRSQYHPKQPDSHAQWAQWGAATAKQPDSHAQQAQWGAATANSDYHPSEASAQVRGVNIRNCGSAGNIINAALSGLNIFSNQFGVLVDCQEQGNCTRIRVDVPADDRKADVRVCNRESNTITVHCDSIRFSTEQLLIQVMIYYYR